MRTKNVKIAQMIIAIIFVVAIAYFIAGIVMDKKTGPLKAQRRFDTFMMETSTLAAKYEPGTIEFNSEFTHLVSTYPNDFSYLRLDVNNMRLYEYPVDGAASSDLVVNDFSGSTNTLLGNTLMVTAMVYTLNASSIYQYAKIAFGLILLGTIIAVILLLILHVQHTSPTYRRYKPDDDLVIEDETDSDSDDESMESDEEPMEADEAELILSTEEHTNVLADAPVEDDEFDPIGAMEEENREAAEELAQEFIDASDGPIHSQLRLEKDLQKELDNAEANNSDVSVLIITINAFREDSAAAKAINLVLTERIGKQGNIYGYNDGYAIFIRNTVLDTALATAQSLYGIIDRILQQNEIKTKISAGISARSERTISASRLITEAEQAALHTDDENPIIAFRVNPERYRQYMQSKQNA